MYYLPQWGTTHLIIYIDEEDEDAVIDSNGENDQQSDRILIQLGNAIENSSDIIVWDPFNPIENRRLMNGHMVNQAYILKEIFKKVYLSI